MDCSDFFGAEQSIWSKATEFIEVKVFEPLRIDTSRIIGFGSHESVFYEGTLGKPPGDRTVAVKCVPDKYREIALKEVEILTQRFLNHENILQFLRWVQCEKWIYICFERYCCSLLDLIQAQTITTQSELPQVLINARGILGKISLWEPKNDGTQHLQLTPRLLKLLRYVVLGLKHIHDKKCTHQGLTPQNILIVKIGKNFGCKLSSIGIGCESIRWKAPEMLENKEPTAAMDIYSLGCVIFDCILPGESLYGVDDNHLTPEFMKKGKANLFKLKHQFPEAHDLLTKMLMPTPKDRPSASEVLLHPFFWDPMVRISFLCTISNKLEMCNPEFTAAINNTEKNFLRGSDWRFVIDSNLMKFVEGHRPWPYRNTVVDLIRLIRKTSHLDFLFPENLKVRHFSTKLC